MKKSKSKVDELAARLQALEQERAKREAERLARLAEPTADDEIEAARLELQAAQAEEHAAEIERLRPAERQHIENIVRLNSEQIAEIEALGETQREIASHGGSPEAQLSPWLYQTLKQAEQVWRMAGYWRPDGGTLTRR